MYDEEYLPWGPITCPSCGTMSMFTVLYARRLSDTHFIALACCPNCNQLVVLESHNQEGKNSRVIKCPLPQVPHPFDNRITRLSPRFNTVYQQAYICESQNLNEISGMGYRKSIEILIKDFLIYRFPNEKDSIVKMPLGACINQKISNDNLKAVASCGVWLGNDHAHYEAKFEDKDLSDMKLFIDATVHWILMELITDEAKAIKPRQ